MKFLFKLKKNFLCNLKNNERVFFKVRRNSILFICLVSNYLLQTTTKMSDLIFKMT